MQILFTISEDRYEIKINFKLEKNSNIRLYPDLFKNIGDFFLNKNKIVDENKIYYREYFKPCSTCIDECNAKVFITINGRCRAEIKFSGKHSINFVPDYFEISSSSKKIFLKEDLKRKITPLSIYSNINNYNVNDNAKKYCLKTIDLKSISNF